MGLGFGSQGRRGEVGGRGNAKVLQKLCQTAVLGIVDEFTTSLNKRRRVLMQ